MANITIPEINNNDNENNAKEGNNGKPGHLVKEEKCICINCNQAYDIGTITFEQRLINDKDFCAVCWSLFMTEMEDENAIDYNSILQKHKSW